MSDQTLRTLSAALTVLANVAYLALLMALALWSWGYLP